MKNFKNLQVWKWDDKKSRRKNTDLHLEESINDKDELQLSITPTVESSEDEAIYIEIPLNPTNLEQLKEILAEAGEAIKRETDAKGRINLGVNHSEEEKKVIIFD